MSTKDTSVTWESRMAATSEDRATKARQKELEPRYGVLVRWVRADDPQDISPEILAARCLGIEYGDPGPLLPEIYCRECWGDRYIWVGNAWGLKHKGDSLSCKHECHKDEVWMATA